MTGGCRLIIASLFLQFLDGSDDVAGIRGNLGAWGIGGQCANLDTFSFSLCCLDCAIDEISESRRHLPAPSLDHSAPQQLTHISGTAHLQFLRAIELRLSSNSMCQGLHTDPYSMLTVREIKASPD